jgi:DNA invertase Pin-like site-specific DNA recombinase
MTELGVWQSGKIQAHHLDRLAVVYVRQSTLQQVLDHQESTRIQYGLVHHSEALGWLSDRVLTIDEDLGKSGSSAEDRSGFQRLVAEVGLNHVGLILGVEMSRLARSSKDWHQLLEICALFGTLIADLDGIYDPSQYNDRLLLGLKGTMSEAELHILKQRLVQGKLNKAQRGELGFHVPIGYVRRPSGEIILEPDEQARDIVKLVFRKFDELSRWTQLNSACNWGLRGCGLLLRLFPPSPKSNNSVHVLRYAHLNVMRYQVAHHIQVGVRVFAGPHKGELTWRRPNRTTLQNLLKNPAYAGAYAYGRSHSDPRKRQAGRPYTGSVVTQPEDWPVLIQDHHPAYISWAQYQQNLRQLQANQTRADTLGITRQGDSLLSGLLVCGKCGARMVVQYHRGRHYRYTCCREAADYGGEICQHLSGPCLDQYVVEQILRDLEPAALELSS